MPRISNWSDHDALVHYLIAPMMVTKPARASRVFHWAKSRSRWFRRAACVALIQGTRREMFFSEIVHLSGLLLSDEDDMVQKGLGWLLRETVKLDRATSRPLPDECSRERTASGIANCVRDPSTRDS